MSKLISHKELKYRENKQKLNQQPDTQKHKPIAFKIQKQGDEYGKQNIFTKGSNQIQQKKRSK